MLTSFWGPCRLEPVIFLLALFPLTSVLCGHLQISLVCTALKLARLASVTYFFLPPAMNCDLTSIRTMA